MCFGINGRRRRCECLRLFAISRWDQLHLQGGDRQRVQEARQLLRGEVEAPGDPQQRDELGPLGARSEGYDTRFRSGPLPPWVSSLLGVQVYPDSKQ